MSCDSKVDAVSVGHRLSPDGDRAIETVLLRVRLGNEHTAAAPPLVGGQAMSRVITPGQTGGPLRTSSWLTLPCETGRAGCFWRDGWLWRESLRRRRATCRISSYARDRPRRNSVAPAERPARRRACPPRRRIGRRRSAGLGRSSSKRGPGFICSKQQYAPGTK